VCEKDEGTDCEDEHSTNNGDGVSDIDW
jgi:hypothetical protein